MFSLLTAGGWPIYFLLFLSVLALTFVIERLLFFRRSKIVPDQLFDQVLQEYSQFSALSPDALAQLAGHSLLGQVLSIVVSRSRASLDELRPALDLELLTISPQIERFLGALGTIASISPLMGLFGTVIGMIEIFGSHTADGSSDPLQLAHGISVALYNTAFGLAIAIPSLIFYRYFRSLANSYLSDIENLAVRLFYALQDLQKPSK